MFVLAQIHAPGVQQLGESDLPHSFLRRRPVYDRGGRDLVPGEGVRDLPQGGVAIDGQRRGSHRRGLRRSGCCHDVRREEELERIGRVFARLISDSVARPEREVAQMLRPAGCPGDS